MLQCTSSRGRIMFRVFFAAVGLASAAALISLHVWNSAYSEEGLRYADSNLPMITAADGFFYLHQAQEYLRAGVRASPLAASTAEIVRHTGVALEYAAFWLPPLSALGMLFWYLGWARLLHLSPCLTGVAVLAGTLVPAWMERSRPGWFDTDPGIAVLWNGCLWATACLGWPGPERRRLLPFLVLVFCGLSLAWWWKPGAVLLPLCLLLWGATFFYARTRREAAARLGTAAILLAGGLLAALLPDAWLPDPAATGRAYALEHLRLILGWKEGAIFASIAEISAVAPRVFLTALGGSAGGGLILLTATLLFCLRQRTAAWFLLPGLLMLILGMRGERFLYLTALPLGLAAACLPRNLGALSERLCGRSATAIVAAALLLVLLGGSQFHWLLRWTPGGYFRTAEDRVAVLLRRSSPPDAAVWAWWDDGYFLRARTRLRPLFDGGSQEPLRAWIAARPLVMENPLQARRWIRFFALRGVAGLAPLTAAWGGEEAAWQHLETIFAAPAPLPLLQSLPPLPGGTRQWLFPEGRVFLFLSQRVLRLSQWWLPLGLQRHPDRADIRPHIDVFPKIGFRHDPATRSLTLPEAAVRKGYAHIGAVLETDVSPLGPPWPAVPGPYAVTSPHSPWLYIANEYSIRSLPLRLMAPGGAEIPGFSLVAADYAAAGAWEVLP